MAAGQHREWVAETFGWSLMDSDQLQQRLRPLMTMKLVLLMQVEV